MLACRFHKYIKIKYILRRYCTTKCQLETCVCILRLWSGTTFVVFGYRVSHNRHVKSPFQACVKKQKRDRDEEDLDARWRWMRGEEPRGNSGGDSQGVQQSYNMKFKKLITHTAVQKHAQQARQTLNSPRLNSNVTQTRPDADRRNLVRHATNINEGLYICDKTIFSRPALLPLLLTDEAPHGEGYQPSLARA